MVRLINQWYIDYRLDIAYKPLDKQTKGEKQAVLVYDKKVGYTVTEYFSESFIDSLYKSVRKGR